MKRAGQKMSSRKSFFLKKEYRSDSYLKEEEKLGETVIMGINRERVCLFVCLTL